MLFLCSAVVTSSVASLIVVSTDPSRDPVQIAGVHSSTESENKI